MTAGVLSVTLSPELTFHDRHGGVISVDASARVQRSFRRVERLLFPSSSSFQRSYFSSLCFHQFEMVALRLAVFLTLPLLFSPLTLFCRSENVPSPSYNNIPRSWGDNANVATSVYFSNDLPQDEPGDATAISKSQRSASNGQEIQIESGSDGKPLLSVAGLSYRARTEMEAAFLAGNLKPKLKNTTVVKEPQDESVNDLSSLVENFGPGDVPISRQLETVDRNANGGNGGNGGNGNGGNGNGRNRSDGQPRGGGNSSGVLGGAGKSMASPEGPPTVGGGKSERTLVPHFLGIDPAISTTNFVINNSTTFLNGANQDFYNYGNDFGHGQGNSSVSVKPLTHTLDQIASAGGNAVRIFLHGVGEFNPQFNASGFAEPVNYNSTLIKDLLAYMQNANSHGIMVIISLWDGSKKPGTNLAGLFAQEDKLDSYINNVLIPIVRSLAEQQGVAGWEIVNQPEGLMKIEAGEEEEEEENEGCLDTTALVSEQDGTGQCAAGWTGADISMKNILRFINFQAHAIRTTDAKALVTVAACSERSITDAFRLHNFYRDSCLRRYGGRAAGVLDFYSVHAFRSIGNPQEAEERDTTSNHNPVEVGALVYHLDRPLLLAGFSMGSTTLSIECLYLHAVEGRYCGGLGSKANCPGNDSLCDGIDVIIRGIAEAREALKIQSAEPTSSDKLQSLYSSRCVAWEQPWYKSWYMESASVVITVLYYFFLSILIILGGHKLFQGWMFLRTKGAAPRPGSLRNLSGGCPFVTIQLPIFNERCVVERMIDASCKLDWPSNKFEVHILDDSTDDTTEVAEAEAAKWRLKGINCRVIIRPTREGFKAGALEYATETHAIGNFLAIFDADFVPPRDFLARMMPYFVTGDTLENNIGFVQSRWGYLNEESSILTKVQAMFLNGHFCIEQPFRARTGRIMNFNGTAGIWRKAAIAEAGGWQHDTITEDSDLSYRAFIKGWRCVYVPQVVSPSELPVSMAAFKTQQRRWTKGMMQVAKKILWRTLCAKIPFKCKVEATFHLCSNLFYLFLLFLLVVFPCYVLVHPILQDLGWPTLPIDCAFLVMSVVPMLFFYSLAEANARSDRVSWIGRLWRLAPLMALMMGMSISMSRAVFQGLFGHSVSFVRTPKAGVVKQHNNKKGERKKKDGGGDLEANKKPVMTYKPKTDLLPFWEICMGFFYVVAIAALIISIAYPALAGHFTNRYYAISILPLMCLASWGFFWVGLSSVRIPKLNCFCCGFSTWRRGSMRVGSGDDGDADVDGDADGHSDVDDTDMSVKLVAHRRDWNSAVDRSMELAGHVVPSNKPLMRIRSLNQNQTRNLNVSDVAGSSGQSNAVGTSSVVAVDGLSIVPFEYDASEHSFGYPTAMVRRAKSGPLESHLRPSHLDESGGSHRLPRGVPAPEQVLEKEHNYEASENSFGFATNMVREGKHKESDLPQQSAGTAPLPSPLFQRRTQPRQSVTSGSLVPYVAPTGQQIFDGMQHVYDASDNSFGFATNKVREGKGQHLSSGRDPSHLAVGGGPQMDPSFSVNIMDQGRTQEDFIYSASEDSFGFATKKVREAARGTSDLLQESAMVPFHSFNYDASVSSYGGGGDIGEASMSGSDILRSVSRGSSLFRSASYALSRMVSMSDRSPAVQSENDDSMYSKLVLAIPPAAGWTPEVDGDNYGGHRGSEIVPVVSPIGGIVKKGVQ